MESETFQLAIFMSSALLDKNSIPCILSNVGFFVSFIKLTEMSQGLSIKNF